MSASNCIGLRGMGQRWCGPFRRAPSFLLQLLAHKRYRCRRPQRRPESACQTGNNTDQATDLTDLAAELGTSREALRSWARRYALLPTAVRPGVALRLAGPQADAIRGAWVRERHGRDLGAQATDQVAGAATDQPAQADQVAPRSSDQAAKAGWREALTLARRESDSLQAQLAVARQEARVARREADEAQRARSATNERLGDLRAAWWRWYALATGWPWWRRARRLPAPPAEMAAGPLPAKLEG